MSIGISWEGGQPRYACGTAIDAFGQAFGGSFSLGGSSYALCSTATDVPH